MNEQEIIRFWFEEIDARSWFRKDPQFDQRLQQRFGQWHSRVAAGEAWQWRQTAAGRLAELIVLDQFSRNLYRDTPAAFACDGMALVLAQEAVAAGADQQLPVEQRAFVYMPYMHSESLMIHQQALTLFDQPGLESSLHFEQRHMEIIERFGRYPHRNAILGRESSEEEKLFLQQPGSSF